MNIYLRFFNNEALVHSLDEIVDFLTPLPGVKITTSLINEIRDYLLSDKHFPLRCQIRDKVYFILIKTHATSLEQFKKKQHGASYEVSKVPIVSPDIIAQEANKTQLSIEREGWYKAELNFKRVALNPITQKYQYLDTFFSAYVYANSPQHCYERVITHLQNRQDVDPRSQFPSARGHNFHCHFIDEVS